MATSRFNTLPASTKSSPSVLAAVFLAASRQIGSSPREASAAKVSSVALERSMPSAAISYRTKNV